MKISLNSPVARLAVDLPEEHVMALLRMALHYASGMTGDVQLDEKPVKAPEKIVTPNPATIPPKLIEEIKTTQPVSDTAVPLKPAPKAYVGYLYVKCESCGKTKGFCVKTPIKRHSCECGHATALENMKPMTAKCKCGAYFKYLTNLTDSVVSIDCHKCGAPVDLEYHEKNNEYTTIG